MRHVAEALGVLTIALGLASLVGHGAQLIGEALEGFLIFGEGREVAAGDVGGTGLGRLVGIEGGVGLRWSGSADGIRVGAGAGLSVWGIARFGGVLNVARAALA